MFDSDGGGVVDGASFSEVAPVTNPPPPGNWGPPQLPYNQGQPPYGPGQWPPQQSWGQPPAPPKNNGLKWLLAGVAVLLVIAISVGATLLVTRDGEDGPTAGPSNGVPSANGDIASADDTGPVSIITEDPTCEPSRPITDTLAEQERQGWDSRDYTIPAKSWTAQQRAMHEGVADAMRSAADQAVELAKKTPHRVMRELYEQSIVFWRAYADSIPNYTAADNYFAMAAGSASGAIVSICSAIDLRAAQSRGPLTTTGAAPDDVSAPLNVAEPTIFVDSSNASACRDWTSASNRFDEYSSISWHSVDQNVPASKWNQDQRSTMTTAAARISQFADELADLQARTENKVLADFAELAVQYWRAFAIAIPSYTTPDSYLSGAAAYSTCLIVNACAAARE